jgi:hypothetical protein
MLKGSLLVIALLLSGCSVAIPVFREYEQADKHVEPISVPSANLKRVIVRFHPRDPTRVMVMTERLFTLNIGPSDWVARLDEFKAAYSGALQRQLHQRGLVCTITDARPFPDIFMIDFTIDCAGALRS